jgi:hypothetical protein
MLIAFPTERLRIRGNGVDSMERMGRCLGTYGRTRIVSDQELKLKLKLKLNLNQN